MIARWPDCISAEIVTGWVHWTVNVSNCKELGVQEEDINISKPQGKTGERPLVNWKTDGIPRKERERQMDRKRENRIE